jgi:hypothetical protein
MRKRIITTAIVFLFVTVIAVATSPNIASAGSKRLLSIATASTGGRVSSGWCSWQSYY